MTDNDPKIDLDEPALEGHHLSKTEVVHTLATSPTEGLTSAEAARRLKEYGYNQLEEAPPTTIWQMLWEQINNFVIYLLLTAAVISFFLGDEIEAAAIMAIVVLNAVFGIIQERQAEQALAALRQMAAPDAQVIRDGHRTTVPARELVVGDIVVLEAGNFIPADVRLLEAVNLKIEEAALTGESVPVEKDAGITLDKKVPLGDRKNTAFMGTVVNYGRGKAVVISTGMKTQIGLIATMLQSVEDEQTPLQKRLDELGRTLGYAALAVCALVFVVGWARGSDPLEMFMVAVSLAIAAVPEGLPAVVTISLALGMREMIKRNALIRKLSSVETLGSATTIGSDKTGTLTQNEMTVTRLWTDGHMFEVTGSGYSPSGEFLYGGDSVDLYDFQSALTTLWVGALNNDSELEASGGTDDSETFRIVGDPTEGALVVAAAKADRTYQHLTKAYPRVQEVPFDSARKRMTTIHKIDTPQKEDISPFTGEGDHKEWHVFAVKGAPDVVLSLCTHYQKIDDSVEPLTEEMRMEVLKANDLMAQDALRVIGVGYKLEKELPVEINSENVEHSFIFVGLQGMIDPARPEVKIALEKARHAGIRTVMITGDYPQTARAIAEQIGLLQPGHQVKTGAELEEMDDETLEREIAYTDVFARVSPEHKVRIVQALRSRGQVVAMTGDGVNDAPALKQADIGVAMGITGTDVAKETADMVLTDDNYSSIVSAVEQGRIIYSNIRKFVYYLISCNLAEIAVIFLATLAGYDSPLSPIQLLWLNLITDGAPALALGTEIGDPDVMDQKPRPPEEPIINKNMRTGIIVQTIAITAVTLVAYFIGLNQFDHNGGHEFASTMAFVTLSFSELLRAFTARSERYPILKVGIFTNRNMNLGVLFSAVMLLAVVYLPFLNDIFNTVPLVWEELVYVVPLLFVPAIAAEVTKWATRKMGK